MRKPDGRRYKVAKTVFRFTGKRVFVISAGSRFRFPVLLLRFLAQPKACICREACICRATPQGKSPI